MFFFFNSFLLNLSIHKLKLHILMYNMLFFKITILLPNIAYIGLIILLKVIIFVKHFCFLMDKDKVHQISGTQQNEGWVVKLLGKLPSCFFPNCNCGNLVTLQLRLYLTILCTHS